MRKEPGLRSLRASSDHRFIVGALRARRTAGCSLIPLLIVCVFLSTFEQGDQAVLYCARPTRAFRGRALREQEGQLVTLRLLLRIPPIAFCSVKLAFGAALGQVFEAGLRCREVSAELPHVLRILRRPMPAQSQPDQPESTVEAFEGDFSIFNVPAKLDVRYSSDMHGS